MTGTWEGRARTGGGGCVWGRLCESACTLLEYTNASPKAREMVVALRCSLLASRSPPSALSFSLSV